MHRPKHHPQGQEDVPDRQREQADPHSGDIDHQRKMVHETSEDVIVDGAGGFTASPDTDERHLLVSFMNGKEEVMTPHAQQKGYEFHEPSAVQKETWKETKPMYDQVLRLDAGDTPEDIFGHSMSEAFRPLQSYEEVCIGCMDERVPGPKIGVAGSGVLMTEIPYRMAEMTDEQIYEYIANPASGDGNFRQFVMNMQALQVKGVKLTTSEHAGCGAVDIFCKKIEALPGWPKDRKLNRSKVAEAAAARLHKALGLPGEHKVANYEKKDGTINMSGAPEIHDGPFIVIAGKDVNLDTLFVTVTLDDGTKERRPVRGLLISARYSPDDLYMQAEVNAGKGIIGGDHGIGTGLLDQSPILLIGDKSDERNSVPGLRKRLGSALDGARVLKMTAQ